jgi:hypothetical protein
MRQLIHSIIILAVPLVNPLRVRKGECAERLIRNSGNGKLNSPEQMLPSIHFRKSAPRFRAVGIGVFAVTALVILFAVIKTESPAAPRHILLSMDANGAPVLFHIPLANTNVRNGVFRAMKAAGIRVWLEVPKIVITNKMQAYGILDTLKAMNRAGVFDTNSIPNPYE